MQVVSVRAENFKGIKLIEVQPNKTTTVIGGPNDAGKSSLLDAIAVALGGQKMAPKMPIRKGQDSAEIKVELDGEPAKLIPPIIVIRTFTKREDGSIKSELQILTKEGHAAPSPQTLLDDCLGKLGFDPESFLRMDPKKQADVLRELVGLDFAELDAKRAKIYENRTLLGREGKSLRGQLDGCKKHDDAPAEEVSITELASILRSIHKVNQENEVERQKLREMEQQIKRVESLVVESEQRVKELERQLEAAKQVLSNYQQMGCDELNKAKEQAKLVNALKDQDTSEIEAQMANAEQINRKVRENAKHAELTAAVNAKLQEWKNATAEIDAIDAQKQKMREEAKWPVPGLGYDENGVTFDGIAFNQVSSSRQRKVAMRICASLNPTLRFAFIKDGGLLDDKGLLEVAAYAAEVGIQLFVERVGKGAECNIVIEGGEVESVDGVPVADKE